MRPTGSFTAEEFGYSKGTIALINRSESYEQYKKYQKEHNDRYLLNLLEKFEEE